MLARGLIRPTFNPLYGSQAFLVPKKGPEKYRMVVDMRKLNQQTKRSSLMMPNLEQQVSYPKGAKFYGSFDILSGFDYLPVAENSRKYFVLVTCFGAYEFCGSPQGWINTPQLFQNRMLVEILQPIDLFGQEDTGVIQWIDDSLLYSRTFDGYITALDKFLKQMILKNLRLNIRKCDLLSKEAEWCGRRITEHGWNYSDKYFSKILKTPKPTFKHELAQALYLANWLSPSVPELAKIRDAFTTEVQLQTTMKQLKKDNEPVTWTPELEKAWHDLLQALETSSRNFLASYDHEQPLCLFADASGDYWGLMLTQCTNCDPADASDHTPLSDQKHQPIFFLSGKFASAQLTWHISQKELYPIIYSFKRLPYLMFGHTRRITVFTDHKNLTYILNPEWSPKSAYIDRLIRWGLLLQNADMCVRHIKGEDNVAADILSRWGNQYNVPSSTTIPTGLLTVLRAQVVDASFENEEVGVRNPWYTGKWQRITEEEVLEHQKLALNQPDLKELVHKRNKLWIPFSILPRLIVHNHFSNSHPSSSEETDYLRTFSFELPANLSLDDMVRGYRERCVHCQRRPKLLRRALNETPITKIPRKILHADYLYINKHSHFLVIVDNATRKVFLKHTKTDNAQLMALALIEFMGNFQLLPEFQIYTDNGSYFASNLLANFEFRLGFSRNFSVQFAPWTNGTVEIANSKILKIVRALVSEYGLYEAFISSLTGIIMHVMNNSPSSIKAGYTPNQLFMDAPANDASALIDRRKLATVVDNEIVDPRNVDNVIENIQKLRGILEEKLQIAYDCTQNRRLRQRRRYNQRWQAKNIQYMKGDWVLFSRAGMQAGRDKTKPNWVGPYQVCGPTRTNVYIIRDLLGKQRVAHAARLWPYAPNTYEPPPNLAKVFLNDSGPLEVERFIDLKFEDGEYFVLTRWLGFSPTDDSWEPMENMTKDLPALLEDFLSSDTDPIFKRALAQFKRLRR